MKQCLRQSVQFIEGADIVVNPEFGMRQVARGDFPFVVAAAEHDAAIQTDRFDGAHWAACTYSSCKLVAQWLSELSAENQRDNVAGDGPEADDL